ncbi:hypothetical protein KO494_00845 [Lacinutrix sp. C3R15]|uniref:DUF6427 family protein n=1 Tax=Flavobacteriaceae TaxID=49546 RepID=UPI001C0A4792|nr:MULTISPECIES: DUF6427 family protein [Flavobacteriaceae]MBU2938073.1 hypothetical protein [Lacinutrix sp. C3R15]MDO6621387.1 DUF6427 family protein [Oceanihabitans sp. 1_MG-2023]
MITSIFSKSKPINFLIVFVLAVLAFLIVKFKHVQQPVSSLFILKQTITFTVAYLSVLLLSFISTKNDLTQKSNLEIILFSLFLLLIPDALISAKVIWANFFILFALRRLISLRTKKNTKSKLFDAALCITIASLFYFWAILFLVLIPLVLLFHSSNDIKHWLIPIVGVVTVFILCISTSIVVNNSYLGFFNSNYQTSFSFVKYNSLPFLVALTLLFSFGFWSVFYYLKNFRTKIRTIRPAYKTILTMLILAFILFVIAPNKNGREILFLFAPLTIIITNYIETIKDKWFKEVFFGILLVTPMILLVLQFFAKS